MSATPQASSAASAELHRSRIALLLLGVLVVALGLASRRSWSPFPAVLGNYPGDMLWAWLVFRCVAWVRPKMAREKLAAVAFLIAFAVEFLQLYQAPWIQALRANKLAYLVLGNGFDPLDLVAYVVGVGFGALVDSCWPYGRSVPPV